jgi:hypothetical protein
MKGTPREIRLNLILVVINMTKSTKRWDGQNRKRQ